jgi:phospholipase C
VRSRAAVAAGGRVAVRQVQLRRPHGTTQSSILSFVEDNWKTGRVGDASFDATAGSLGNLFDYRHPQQRAVLLAANGTVAATPPLSVRPVK